jgi:hypothetical protein
VKISFEVTSRKPLDGFAPESNHDGVGARHDAQMVRKPRNATAVGVNEEKDVRLAVPDASLKLVREHQVVRAPQGVECRIEGEVRIWIGVDDGGVLGMDFTAPAMASAFA